MNEYAIARANMVESQVRPNRVTDLRIVRAMLAIPREEFLPEAMRPLAYMDDEAIVRPAGRDRPARRLPAPMVLARLIQLADVGSGDLVLDVGCASGYSTAILSRLAGAVVGLECEPELAEAATATLQEQDVDNAVVVVGPLPAGHPGDGPYDAIVLGGAVPEAPDALLSQLKEGGRLVAVLAGGGMGRAHVFERIGGQLAGRPAFDASAPPLPGFDRAPSFVF